MKTKSILIIAILAMLSVSAFAGQTVRENTEAVKLTGCVVDDKNKEMLAGAAVYVDGKKYYSDLDGNFSISDIKPGKYQIKVELISYKPVIMEIDVNKDEKISINLPQS